MHWLYIKKKSNFINKKLLCYNKQMTNIKLKKNANIMKFNSRRSALCRKIFVLHTSKPAFHAAASKFWCTWKEPVTAIRLLEFRHWFLIDLRTHEFSIDSINPPLQWFPNYGSRTEFEWVPESYWITIGSDSIDAILNSAVMRNKHILHTCHIFNWVSWNPFYF